MKRNFISLLVALTALFMLFAFSACAPEEPNVDEPVKITGISLSEDGVLTWNAVPGATTYRLVVGMSSDTTSETTFELRQFNLSDGTHTVGVFASKDTSEMEIGFGELKFTLQKGVYTSDAAEIPVEPDLGEVLDSPKLVLERDALVWDSISGAVGYRLTVDGQETELKADQTSYTIEDIAVGSFTASIVALAEDDRLNSEPYSATLTFEMFSAGNGTAETPYIITTAEHFSNIQYFSSKNFEISSNHQLNGAQATQIGSFSGVLDGNGAIIRDFTVIDSSEDGKQVAWFDTLETGAAIRNLNLQITEVASDVFAKSNYGTMAGLSVQIDGVKASGYSLLTASNYGTVSDCEVSGSATQMVYAIAGNQEKTLENNEKIEGVIRNVTASLNIRVEADSMSVYGYSGMLCRDNYGSIENSRVSGTMEITCEDAGPSSNPLPVYIGGFVGDNRGSILRCESNVQVILNFGQMMQYALAAGEFAGRNGSGGEITESRSAGSIEVSLLRKYNQLELGGFVGANEGILASCSAEGSVSLQMENPSNPIGWMISNASVGGLVGSNTNIGAAGTSGSISDSFVRNALSLENFGNEDEKSGDIFGKAVNDAMCENCYAVSYDNIELSDKWLIFVNSAPILKVFAEDTPVITDKVAPVLDKGVVSWEAQPQAEYYLVRIDDGEPFRVETCSVDLKNRSWSASGQHTLYIMVCNDDYAKGEWAELEFNVYSFSVWSNDTEKTCLYQVEGAEIPLSDYLYSMEGHTPTGFTDEQNNSYETDAVYVLNGDVKLTVQYEINPYTIQYFTMKPDGSWVQIESRTLDFGAAITYPAATVDGWDPAGYTFAGWYLDDSLVTENSYTTVPAKDLELYAKFTRNEFELVVNTNNEENEAHISVPYDTLVTGEYIDQKLGEVTYFGYTFKGWYSDEKLNTPFKEFRMGTQPVQIYAKWEINSYTITVDEQGGSYEGEIPETFTVEEDVLYLPTAEKYGYTFQGWSINGSDYGVNMFDRSMYAEEITLTALFTPNTYRIEYNYGDGTVSGEKSYTVSLYPNGTDFQLNPNLSWNIKVDKDHPLTVPSYYGAIEGVYYTWHTDKNCESDPYDFSAPVTENLHLYCKRHTSSYSQAMPDGSTFAYYATAGTFTATEYFVVDGSNREYEVSSKLSFRTGSQVPYLLKSVETTVWAYGKTGSSIVFSGEGVYTDSNGRAQYLAEVNKIFEVGTVLMVETTFTVQKRSGNGITDFNIFMSDINHQVRLEIGGENGVTQGKAEWRYDNIVFGETFGQLPVSERFGYEFVGWFYDGKLYTADSVLDIASDLTLVAQFEPIYKDVKYELNGGTNHSDNPAQYSIEDGSILLSSAEKEGYRFMGWYLDAEYKQSISSFDYETYQNGIMLYARFEKLYTVSYVLPEYAGTMDSDTRIASEYFTPKPLGDIANGDAEYRFAGWYADASYTEQVTSISDRAEDVVLYAKFVPLYHVTAHLDGGSLMVTIPKFTAEDEIDLSSITAEKANHLFLGWYLDADFQEAIQSIPAGTEQNIEIYAKYVRCTDGLEFTLNNDGTGYIVSASSAGLGETDIVIPEEYRGLPVQTIGSFANQSAMTSVSIPKNAREILTGAFKNCTGLQSFEVPAWIVSIGEGAFSGCKNLQMLTIPFIGQTKQDVLPFGVIFGKDAYSGATRTEQPYKIDNSIYNMVFYIPDALKSVTVNGGTLTDGAFRNCVNIETIACGGTVTSVGEEAFLNAISLKTVDMDGVISIGEKAFFGCTSLTEFIAPEALVSLGVSVFEDCTKLQNVDLGSVQVLGERAFAGCTSLKSVTVPATVSELPAEVFPVLDEITFESGLEIQQAAFEDASTLTVRVATLNIWCAMNFAEMAANPLSEGAELLIGGQALPQQLIIPDTITEIGSYVFCGLDFTEITVPASVNKIGDGAFANNSALILARIEASDIGVGIFEGCSAMQEMSMPGSDLGSYFGASNMQSEYSKVPKSLASFTLLSGTKIADYAFYNTKITELVLPDTITSIGSYAFYGMKIEKWSFSENVKTIGVGALGGCSYLEEVDLRYMTNIGKGVLMYSNVKTLIVPFIGKNMSDAQRGTQNLGFFFAKGTDDGRNDIPTNLETVEVLGGGEIGSDTFAGCANIENLILQNVLVEPGALFGLSNLKTLEVPHAGDHVTMTNGSGGVTYERYDPFGVLFGTTSFANSVSITQKTKTYQNGSWYEGNVTYYVPGLLKQVTIGEKLYPYSFHNYNNGYYSIDFIIGDGVVEIPEYAFANCTKMKIVTIGENVSAIEQYAFSGCSNITEIRFAGTMEQLFGIEFGESWNPGGVYNAKEYTLTVNDTVVGSRLEVPDSVTELHLDAFIGVKTITELVLPVGITKVWSGLNAENVDVYYAGSEAQWLNIEFVAPIAKSFALYCQGSLVEAIDIPNDLTAISDYAFSGCTSLKSISFSERSQLQTIGTSAFENCINLSTALIPIGVGQLTEIGDNAFKSCSSLTGFQIPASVSILGVSAFEGCTALKTVEFGTGSLLTAIPNRAFNLCSSLTEICIPFGVTRIGENAFYGATSLQEVTFEGTEGANALTTIDKYAFTNCSKLASFIVSKNMQTFGTQAFKGCTSLVSVYNYSSLPLVQGSSAYGCVAFYATEVIAKTVGE